MLERDYNLGKHAAAAQREGFMDALALPSMPFAAKALRGLAEGPLQPEVKMPFFSTDLHYPVDCRRPSVLAST
jgi:hypothetical protein